jgi:hypothetical protein
MYPGGNGVASPQDLDYTVVLVFPGFGVEREHAETIVESALCWLNTCKDKPGFRFAAPVCAHLKLVQDADEARATIAADKSVAMVLVHDLADDQRNSLLRHCENRQISACHTVDAPPPRTAGLGTRIRDQGCAHRPRHVLQGNGHVLAGAARAS